MRRAGSVSTAHAASHDVPIEQEAQWLDGIEVWLTAMMADAVPEYPQPQTAPTQ